MSQPLRRRAETNFFVLKAPTRAWGRRSREGKSTAGSWARAPQIDSDVELFDELCWRLLGVGVPLWRATLYIGHVASADPRHRCALDARVNVIEEFRILHGSEATDEYLLSPIRATIERGTPFRRRLTEEAPEYPLLSKLRKNGATDYFALALNHAFQRFPVVTWATDRPGGFADTDIARSKKSTRRLPRSPTPAPCAGSAPICSTPISGRRLGGGSSPGRFSGPRASGCVRLS